MAVVQLVFYVPFRAHTIVIKRFLGEGDQMRGRINVRSKRADGLSLIEQAIADYRAIEGTFAFH